MARTKSIFNLKFTREHTFETVLVTGKDVSLLDPEFFAEAERFDVEPPTRGYVEIWSHNVPKYDVYPLTIKQLSDYITSDTLSMIEPIGTVLCDSSFIAVSTAKRKLKSGIDKTNMVTIPNWSGKIYIRMYYMTISAKNKSVDLSFFTIEGVKSGSKITSFVCWPSHYTTQFLSSVMAR